MELVPQDSSDRDERSARLFSEYSRYQYVYIRVNFDFRALQLCEDGTVGEGAAGCEAFWWPEEENLVLAGKNGEVAVRLTISDDGTWRGKWEHHEQMAIILAPVGLRLAYQ